MPYKDRDKQREFQRNWCRQNADKLRPKKKAYKKKHRKKLSAQNREYINTRKLSVAWLKTLKECLECEICGEDEAIVIDLHHIDPSQKSFGLHAANASRNINDLVVEVNKCMALCANCHRRVHVLIREKDVRKSA